MHRADELRAVEAFLDGVRVGPRALVIGGDPGIGKTTLVGTVTAQAHDAGIAVAAVHVGRPETSLSFAALGDLLETVPDKVLDELSAPLRDALAITMLRTPGAEVRQDPRAVSLATLAVVRRLAAERPLLVVIDDLQWLDVSSARVFSFLLQRLDREPFGLLATRRTGEGGTVPLSVERDLSAARTDHLLLGPMPQAEFVHMLHDRVTSDLPRSIMLGIHRAVEGNPFFGQELAREVVRRGVPEPGVPLPLPEDAFGAVRQRLSSLGSDTREVLTMAALTSRPTIGVLARALPEVDVGAALAEAECEELVVLGQGRVTFQHAIFASVLTAGTPAPERRRAHRALAGAYESVEERARHLALSSLEPETAVADALEEAQVVARRRGATAAAAELAALSQTFTPETEPSARIRRAVSAGMLAFEAGDAVRGQESLRRLVAEMPPGPERAVVRVTLCEISWQDTVEVESLASAAIEEPGAEPATIAAAHLMLAWASIYRGELVRAQKHVDDSRQFVDRLADEPGVRSDMLTAAALTAFLTGREYTELIAEGVWLEEVIITTRPTEATTIYSGARVTRGLIALWSLELEGARRYLEAELDRLDALGRFVARDEILCYLAHVACRTGAWADAEHFAEECLEIAHESGHVLGRGQNLLPSAWLAAVRGDLEAARVTATEALTLSTAYRDEIAAATAYGVLGLAALSSGDVPTAVAHGRRVVHLLDASKATWPWMASFVADAVEAFIGTGLLDEAEAAVQAHELRRRPDRRTTDLARGVAALAAGRGDLVAAATELERALVDPELTQQPFELARVLLVAGEVERRRRLRPRARAYLERAATIFSELGAPVWAERARAELGRLAGSGGVTGLSSTEVRLVGLVAEGLKNRELAGRLFVSVKTIEANLSHIYRKTGLRSRQELVRWWLTEESTAD